MIKHIIKLIWNKKKSNFLMFLEIFFSFLILFAVFTFVVSNLRMYQSPLGFDTEDMWLAHLSFPSELDSATVADTKLRLVRELNAKPEIISVGFTNSITPFSGSTWVTSNDDNGFDLQTWVVEADEHYGPTAGVNIVEGRWFNEEDALGKYPAVVFNRKLWEEYFDEQPVLDSIYKLNGKENIVVGIVENYKYRSEFEEEYPTTLFHKPVHDAGLASLHIRLQPGTSVQFEEEVNQTIAGITKRSDFIIENLDEKRKDNSRSTWIPMITLLSICLFLILNVALGLFGVLWYNISKRRSEIGLRRALGATADNISFQFISEIMLVTIAGILAGSFFTLQFPLMKLLEVENIDYYYAMGLSALIITVLVLVCAFYPSRQAAGINPAIALHED